MPTISEIYETEHGRESYDTIHLFAEGSFWRAYEYSAWLFTNEKHLIISVQGDVVEADSTEELKGMFEIWKDNIEVSAPSKQNSQNTSSGQHTDSNVKDISITGVMREILAFPIESKTPMESMLFLAELKKKLSKII